MVQQSIECSVSSFVDDRHLRLSYMLQSSKQSYGVTTVEQDFSEDAENAVVHATKDIKMTQLQAFYNKSWEIYQLRKTQNRVPLKDSL